jgi:hypothetical protein
MKEIDNIQVWVHSEQEPLRPKAPSNPRASSARDREAHTSQAGTGTASAAADTPQRCPHSSNKAAPA